MKCFRAIHRRLMLGGLIPFLTFGFGCQDRGISLEAVQESNLRQLGELMLGALLTQNGGQLGADTVNKAMRAEIDKAKELYWANYPISRLYVNTNLTTWSNALDKGNDRVRVPLLVVEYLDEGKKKKLLYTNLEEVMKDGAELHSKNSSQLRVAYENGVTVW